MITIKYILNLYKINEEVFHLTSVTTTGFPITEDVFGFGFTFFLNDLLNVINFL